MIATEVRTEGNALEVAFERLEEYRARLTEGLQARGNEIREKIQNEQMSGRHGDNTGLNIITGRGRDSWRTYTQVLGEVLLTTVYNLPEAFYLRFHEDGAGHNPKRLFVEEGPTRDFAENLYLEEAIQSLNILAAA